MTHGTCKSNIKLYFQDAESLKYVKCQADGLFWPLSCPTKTLHLLLFMCITECERFLKTISALIFLHEIRADMRAALRPKNTKMQNQSLLYTEQNSNTTGYSLLCFWPSTYSSIKSKHKGNIVMLQKHVRNRNRLFFIIIIVIWLSCQYSHILVMVCV